jgi:hypothetical protein
MSDTHCDDYIHDPSTPLCLQYFLLVHRLPAVDGCIITAYKGEPECYATWKGTKRVRLVMASRFGDVGITPRLKDRNGYTARVSLDELSDFSDKP